ncbi:MAG: hypothetical protein H2184_18415 [Candidatus Galacturonibacter soehngenii]|nr:hypothetical protein [Candidatus Galacturonibacter soehngenii]
MNTVNGMPEPVKQLTTFLGRFADSVLKNVYNMDIGSEPYSKTYQTTYNKGEITGDIVSMLLGLITAASGASTMPKGAGIMLVSTATGQIEISGAGAGIMVLGATETAAGIKISISASKKLGEDVGKGGSKTSLDRSKSDFKHYKDAKQIEKKFNLKKGSFHPEGGDGIKADILQDIMSKFPKELKKLGNNPDISFADDGQIMIESTKFKGKSFVTDLNINNYK